MLPGFRFLLAAIVLSMSILVFGLGAAALLRAADEEFASTPSWHAPPETIFAQQNEASGPVLAMLRVEPPPAEPKAPDNVPVAAAPAEPAATVPTAEPETIAALKPEDSAAPEMTKPEIPASDNPATSEAAPAAADAPAAASETRIAATEQDLPPMSEAAPATPEAISAPESPQADIASTKIATLGGPPVAVETPPPAKAAGAKPDRSVINKRLQARRAAQRRGMALRAQQARLTPPQPADPFAQPPAAARKR
jgi:hypothetical protein